MATTFVWEDILRKSFRGLLRIFKSRARGYFQGGEGSLAINYKWASGNSTLNTLNTLNIIKAVTLNILNTLNTLNIINHKGTPVGIIGIAESINIMSALNTLNTLNIINHPALNTLNIINYKCRERLDSKYSRYSKCSKYYKL